MKYANLTGRIYLREDSRETLDPERAFNVRQGQEFPSDHPLVIDRPELFTDTPQEEEK